MRHSRKSAWPANGSFAGPIQLPLIPSPRALVPIVEIEAGILAAAHAFHAEYLLVRLATDVERHQVVAGVDDGSLGTAPEAAAAPAAAARLAGHAKELLQILHATGEGIQRIQRILLSAGALRALALRLAAAAAGTHNRAFTRTSDPCATGAPAGI